MTRLIFLKGLPASGKSTWAKEQVEQSKGRTKRVNKDDLRLLLDMGRWSKVNEQHINKVQNKLVDYYLKEGFDVIVDNTHLAPQHEQTMREIARVNKAEFEIKDFYIPVSEAEERDALRSNGVGPKVIRKMWRQYCIQEYRPSEGLPNAIITDLDGTLAGLNGRDPYQEQLVEQDIYNEVVGSAVQLMAKQYKAKVIITSGRHDSCQQATERWLHKHDFNYDKIMMRPSGISGKEAPDWQVKNTMYDTILQSYNVVVVFDDRETVVSTLRERGLRVFAVADGRF